MCSQLSTRPSLIRDLDIWWRNSFRKSNLYRWKISCHRQKALDKRLLAFDKNQVVLKDKLDYGMRNKLITRIN